MSGSNKDKCINCKKETLYGNKTHTDFRIGYVEGAGQLCLDCYGVIYKQYAGALINSKEIRHRGEA